MLRFFHANSFCSTKNMVRQKKCNNSETSI
jgi:hypothetical protein